MLGCANDYIACRDSDAQDIYIIKKEIFDKTYKLFESNSGEKTVLKYKNY